MTLSTPTGMGLARRRRAGSRALALGVLLCAAAAATASAATMAASTKTKQKKPATQLQQAGAALPLAGLQTGVRLNCSSASRPIARSGQACIAALAWGVAPREFSRHPGGGNARVVVKRRALTPRAPTCPSPRSKQRGRGGLRAAQPVRATQVSALPASLPRPVVPVGNAPAGQLARDVCRYEQLHCVNGEPPAAWPRARRCEALVESIRSQGRWGGRLYLITEQLKCYQVRPPRKRSHESQHKRTAIHTL